MPLYNQNNDKLSKIKSQGFKLEKEISTHAAKKSYVYPKTRGAKIWKAIFWNQFGKL